MDSCRCIEEANTSSKVSAEERPDVSCAQSSAKGQAQCDLESLDSFLTNPSPTAGSASDGVSSENSLGTQSSPNARRMSSWRQFAGRSSGSEGYQFGDFSRGLWQALNVASVAVRTTVHDNSVVSLDDLEPIDATDISHQSLRLFSSARRKSVADSVRRNSNVPLRFSMPGNSMIGEGQYGCVWCARNRRTHRIVAVKTSSTGGRDRDLALRELEVAEHIRNSPHPCLVRFWGLFHVSDADVCSIVMEYCPGGDLQQKIACARTLAHEGSCSYEPPPSHHRWASQIFLGLEHVHLSVGMLYRDLKPGNVVFSSGGCAKITDFGVGRLGLASDGAWTFGFPTGSPGYMAPEIFEGESYDHRADFYSFGVLLWVLLTGGVTDSDEPRPPVSPLKDDWELFTSCLEEPEENNAHKLKDPALNLIQQLAQRSPSSRPQHLAVREHAFFIPQRLPPPLGRPGEQSTTLQTALQWLQEDPGIDKCTTPGCIRRSWNGWPGEPCCRTCVSSKNGTHGPDCNRIFNSSPNQ